MEWIEEHEKECKINDSDKCNGCFHISQTHWALSEAQEEMDQKKNQPKPKVETKLDWDYKLRQWREVIK